MRVLNPLVHETLRGTLQPIGYSVCSSNGQPVEVLQYRNLKYGHISKRFDRSTEANGYRGETLDCTAWGPRCPQNSVDVGSLLRIPKRIRQVVPEQEDEFDCLNLAVTLPEKAAGNSKQGLPVVVWIPGGSQTVSFVSAASEVCDPSLLVADAAQASKPCIFVFLNYRLNIFGFGNLDGESYNLGLLDQQVAINWVRTHIASFGGDPRNITVAGESAGAFCTHAHTLLYPKGTIRRAILQSGHLWTSPPQPLSRGQALIETIRDRIAVVASKYALEDLPVDQLLQILKDLQIKSVWNHEQHDLEGWEHRVPNVEAILVGDCEYEASLFAYNMATCSPENIISAFKDLEMSEELLSSYHIEIDRPSASIIGALDILADVRFSWSGQRAAEMWKAQTKVIKYTFDEPNPWQPSARAHHAVDLLFLFGTYQDHFPEHAARLSVKMRQHWIDFVTSDSPRDLEDLVFGPHGTVEKAQPDCIAVRRRSEAWQTLDKIGYASLNKLAGTLGLNKISLDT
ncbi:hypothetical protein LTS10_012922 [Elasticomyces elasticus]|nr:hypothetical protein LTS10_012922 [Elasticomyces elasticus]